MPDLMTFINLLKLNGITDKSYTTLADLASDVSADVYKDKFTSFKNFEEYDEYTTQNIPFVTVYSSNKEVLNKILKLENVFLLDESAELFIYPSLDVKPYERVIKFNNDYKLKNDETFYIEIDPSETTYSFIKNKLTKFCKDNHIKLHSASVNDNGIVCNFDINENGDLISNVEIKGGELHVDEYLYLVYQLRLMFDSLDDLKECNVTLEDIKLI